MDYLSTLNNAATQSPDPETQAVAKAVREFLAELLARLGNKSLDPETHPAAKVVIQNLELITLLKNGEKWQVALNEQAPKVTALDGRKLPPQGR